MNPTVLQAVLQGVQGFVATLAAERKQHQPQAAAELRQRLAALADAAAASMSQQQQQRQGQQRAGSLSWHSEDSSCHVELETAIDAAAAFAVAEQEKGGSDEEASFIDLVFATPSVVGSLQSDGEASSTHGSSSSSITQAPSDQDLLILFHPDNGLAAGGAVGARIGTDGDFDFEFGTWGDSDSLDGAEGAEARVGAASSAAAAAPSSSGSAAGAETAAAAAAAAAGSHRSQDAAAGAREGAAARVSQAAAGAFCSGSAAGIAGEGIAEVNEPAARSSSSSSSVCSSSSSDVVTPHPYLSAVMDVPDPAELLGVSNLRSLLLLYQQHLRQALQQQPQALQQRFLPMLEQSLHAVQPGQPLQDNLCKHLLLLLDLSESSDEAVLHYWRAFTASVQAAALAAADGIDHNSSSSSSSSARVSSQLLASLLQLAGIDAAAAEQLVKLCMEVRDLLLHIEMLYAAACCKEAFEVECAIMKPGPAAAVAAAAAGSPQFSGSSVAVDADGTLWLLNSGEPLPHGLQFDVTYIAVHNEMFSGSSDAGSSSSSSAAEAAGMLAWIANEALAAAGAVATHSLAVLLVRVALAKYPWQQASSSTTAAAAAAAVDETSSKRVLQGRLQLQQMQLDRLLQVLQRAIELMQPEDDQDQQQQQQQSCSVLHELLRRALPDAEETALERCTEHISIQVNVQLMLSSVVQETLYSGAPISGRNSTHAVAWALSAAALHLLHRGNILQELQHWQGQLTQPLAVHYTACSTFDMFVQVASSDHDGSYSASASAAAALHKLSTGHPDRWAPLTPPGSLQLLLAAVETALCQRLGRLLADSARLQESTSQLAGKVAAGAAECDAFLTQASWSGPVAAQLDKTAEITQLLRLAEELLPLRQQLQLCVMDLQEQLSACIVLCVRVNWLWQLVEQQWERESNYVRRQEQQQAELHRQQRQQLLDQLVASQLSICDYSTQLDALRQAESATSASIASIKQWQQQQQQDTQPMQHALSSIAASLEGARNDMRKLCDSAQQQQAAAEAAPSAAAEFWQNQLLANVSRGFTLFQQQQQQQQQQQ
jgi:hypothetical protein